MCVGETKTKRIRNLLVSYVSSNGWILVIKPKTQAKVLLLWLYSFIVWQKSLPLSLYYLFFIQFINVFNRYSNTILGAHTDNITKTILKLFWDPFQSAILQVPKIHLDLWPYVIIGTYFKVLISSIYKPFIHFITDAECVIFDAKVSNYLEFLFGIYLYRLKEMKEQSIVQHARKWWARKLHKEIKDPLTLPMGLCGVFIMIALVLELNLLSNSLGSIFQSELDSFFPATGF